MVMMMCTCLWYKLFVNWAGCADFRNKTEADIYVLLSERREEMEEALGWQIDPEAAVPELISQKEARPLFTRMLDTVAPGLEEGPAYRTLAKTTACAAPRTSSV